MQNSFTSSTIIKANKKQVQFFSLAPENKLNFYSGEKALPNINFYHPKHQLHCLSHYGFN